MSRRATSRTRQARHAANGSLTMRSGAPAAAVAAVSSLTLTGVAVLGFMPGGSAFTSLHADSGGLRGPGVVEAIPFSSPTPSTSRPSSGFTVRTSSGATVQHAAAGTEGQTAGRSPSSTRSTSRPTSTSTSQPVRTPAVPAPIIVAVGDLPAPLASSAREMVVRAVNSSLSAVMPRKQLLAVQPSLGPAVDLAVRTAVSSAAQDALDAATAATASKATSEEVSAVTTQTFRARLTPALAATVPAAVSTTLTTAGVVSPEAAPVVDALVTVAASTASDDVADVTTPSVVEQVTTVVTTPGATPTTPVLSPSPTTSTTDLAPTDTATSPTSDTPTETPTEPTEPTTDQTSTSGSPTSTEEPTGTPETPDADADPTDESNPPVPDFVSPTAVATLPPTAAGAAPTTVPTIGPFAGPAGDHVPAVVASVFASHVLVAQLARQTPVNPAAAISTPDFFRVAPHHLVVRVTTTASASPTSKPHTTTMVVPTRTVTPTLAGRSAAQHVTKHSAKGDEARRERSSTHTKKQSRKATKDQKASTPRRTSTPTPSRTGDRPQPTSTPSTTGGLPDGFFSWTPREQWHWLQQSGQQLTYSQWMSAVRQQVGSRVTAGATHPSAKQRPSQQGVGKHRR